MQIIIEYFNRLYKVKVIGDYKVSMPLRNFPFQDHFSKEDIQIELEQCKECGKWCSEDDELYGDGYCDGCAQLCFDCELYYNSKDMHIICNEEMASTVSNKEMICTKCHKLRFPNNYKLD